VDLSKLSGNARTAAVAGAVVVITGLISLVNDWGALMLVALLAGAAVVIGAVLPQLSPGTSLPVSSSMLMLGGGVVAAVCFVVTAVDWLGWIGDHLGSFDTLQFLVGLVASLVTAWAGWRAYQESGRMGSATPPRDTPA
jgi:hypothetical protein